MTERIFNVLHHIEPIYRFSKNYQLVQKHVVNGFLKVADDVLEEKRALQLKADDVKDVCNYDGYNRQTTNFYNTAANPKNNWSDEEIRDEINTMIAAVKTCVL